MLFVDFYTHSNKTLNVSFSKQLDSLPMEPPLSLIDDENKRTEIAHYVILPRSIL
jgi:hypothetical protein